MSFYQAIGEFGLNELLAKRLTTPGGSSAPAIAPELFPVLALESDRPEWGYLKQELLYSRGLGTTAPAANSHVILRNPAGSGIIAVVSRIQAVASAGVFSLFLAPTGNLAAGSLQGGCPVRDGRQAIVSGGIFSRQSSCLVYTADAAESALTALWRSGSATLDLDVPFVLTPGMDLGIVCRTITATMSAAFAFTERRAQPGELV